jgi:hypothetical protein
LFDVQLLSEHVMALHAGKRMRKKRKSHPDERSELESVTVAGENDHRYAFFYRNNLL